MAVHFRRPRRAGDGDSLRRRAAASFQSRHDHHRPSPVPLPRRLSTRSTRSPSSSAPSTSGSPSSRSASRIHRLYFWNMLGSGLGGFVLLAALYLLPTERLVGPLAALASLAALLSLVGLPRRRGAALLSLRSQPGLGGPHVRLPGSSWPCSGISACPNSSRSTTRDPSPTRSSVYHSFGPTGEFDAYSSSFFHVAPGLSDNASSNIVAMPENAFLGLYVDGDGPVGIMRKLEPSESAYFDYLPMAAPYLLLDRPDVLLLRLGGGLGADAAIHHDARSATIVEPDPALVSMLRDEPFLRYTRATSLRDPRIRVVPTEPRAFALDTKERFDLVGDRPRRFGRPLPDGRKSRYGELPLHGRGDRLLPGDAQGRRPPVDHRVEPTDAAAQRAQAALHRGRSAAHSRNCATPARTSSCSTSSCRPRRSS